MMKTLTEKVEKRGDEWCVLHGSGPDAGKAIKCFPTKDKADAMHRAIMAGESGVVTGERARGTLVKAHKMAGQPVKGVITDKETINKHRKESGLVPRGVITSEKRMGAIEARLEEYKRKEFVNIETEIGNLIDQGWKDAQIVNYLLGKYSLLKSDRDAVKNIVVTVRGKQKTPIPIGQTTDSKVPKKKPKK